MINVLENKIYPTISINDLATQDLCDSIQDNLIGLQDALATGSYKKKRKYNDETETQGLIRILDAVDCFRTRYIFLIPSFFSLLTSFKIFHLFQQTCHLPMVQPQFPPKLQAAGAHRKKTSTKEKKM